MNQMSFTVVEEDIMASCIRRQAVLCRGLIRQLENKNVSENDVFKKIQDVEVGLGRLCRAS